MSTQTTHRVHALPEHHALILCFHFLFEHACFHFVFNTFAVVSRHIAICDGDVGGDDDDDDEMCVYMYT